MSCVAAGTEDSDEAWARTRLPEAWSLEVRVRDKMAFAPGREPRILSPSASNPEAEGKASGSQRPSKGYPKDGCVVAPNGACGAYQGEASSTKIGARHL
ncbi:hypothetical protein GUJ93_ZPchr0010g9159 [Zizania palustris]|uniref:Uncharacterized protein n=1 Tax=Zizania palustris TaxID=103762 RepID=A0A8J5WFA8_ZIZPA|nr:hypothetical protein GUJ93_ZPchr0010g9159 [Zizania palustris]